MIRLVAPDRNSGWWNRVGAFSGVLFVLLTVAGSVLGSPPVELQPEQPAPALANELAARRSDAQTGLKLILVGVFFFFWFLAFLRDHLRKAEQGRGWTSSVAFGGGLAAGTLLLVGAAAGFAETVPYGDDPVVAKTFFVYGWEYFNVLGPPLTALVIATAAASFRFTAFPRWFAWTSGGFGLLLLFLLLTVPGMGTMVALAWILLASGVLLLWPRGVR